MVAVFTQDTPPSYTVSVVQPANGTITLSPPGPTYPAGSVVTLTATSAAGWHFASGTLPLVYMLLAALFESFSQPFAIMFSVPFALFGVGVVMKLANQPWDTMTMLGMVVLVGVVVDEPDQSTMKSLASNRRVSTTTFCTV